MSGRIAAHTVIAICLAVLSLFSSPARAAQDPEKDYQDFRTGLIELYNNGKYEEISKLIEENYGRFPGKASNMSYNMALVCGHLEDYDRGIEYLSRALDKGQWFNIYAFTGDFWAPYRDKEGFGKIMARNLEMKEEAQKKAKPKLEVVVPGELEEGKKYPLFIALHGGGENIEAFKPNWRSNIMESEFIIAYVQSSQVASMNGFTWEDQEVAKKEIGEAYEKVLSEYPVDEGEVIVGGFSSGGYASLVAVFFEVVPAEGFVILCPPMPDNLTAAEVAGARDRGVRGTIMTTELDNRVPAQRAMADLFRDNGLQYQFILTPDIGHWYPENISDLIDAAIVHIRSR